MNIAGSSLLVVWGGLTVLAGPSSAQEIDRSEVERIITTLSADDMEGRRVFSPGIERAARFIQEEFAAIELETLDGLDGYAQPFKMYSFAAASSRVVLNGRAVPSDRYGVRVAQEAIHWTEKDDINLVRVGKDDDVMQLVLPVTNSDLNTLVLVHESHRSEFDRIKTFMSRPVNTMEVGTGASFVLVLTGESDVDSYEIVVTATVTERDLGNVVGVITGRRRDEIVLFSAHYDHIGIRSPVNGDSIANGANDDASGTTAVISLAKYFKAMGRPERTLMFVAFTGEESGGYGSRYFSQQVDPDDIVAMFNIEMIGKPAREGPNTAWITGFERSSFGRILQEAVDGTPYSFYPDPYPDQNLFYRSDNATFARLGVPAHSISTTPIDVDPDYHRVTDEVATLDLDHMTATIEALAKGAATIVSGAATPTRVDASQVN